MQIPLNLACDTIRLLKVAPAYEGSFNQMIGVDAVTITVSFLHITHLETVSNLPEMLPEAGQYKAIVNGIALFTNYRACVGCIVHLIGGESVEVNETAFFIEHHWEQWLKKVNRQKPETIWPESGAERSKIPPK
jgi:hypothetical protein